MPAPPAHSQFKSALVRQKSWFRLDPLTRWFFGANATVSIVVLVLITIFLFREGSGFFSQNKQNIEIYRLAGLEYVDIIRRQLEAHSPLIRELNRIRSSQLKALMNKGASLPEANAALAGLDDYSTRFSDAVTDLQGILSDLTEAASAVKEKAKLNEDAQHEREMLIAAGRAEEARQVAIARIDFAAEVAPIRAVGETAMPMADVAAENIKSLAANLPALPVPDPKAAAEFQRKAFAHAESFPKMKKELANWDQFARVPWYRSLSSFILGREWITNSFWQDWYGIIPLFTGSLLVSFIALLIAVPLSVASAIYVSEVASVREQKLIKPCLEFIAAIPSVVLGFFGIAVLGETIRALTRMPVLSWVSVFPISERLNVFTAGCLLALMAVPTIFSLSEDALNNVPKAFKEASYALGATRLQTIVRILVPASLSGIISAILLGLGRVIGETMVVLLCAGNRIQIPDFTEGLGAFFQPVHTMTGIIAQEMGEVVRGSIHYRALFVVGMLLFILTLGINIVAQQVVKRYRISIG